VIKNPDRSTWQALPIQFSISGRIEYGAISGAISGASDDQDLFGLLPKTLIVKISVLTRVWLETEQDLLRR
jgi:hypothetical protein